MENRDPDSGRIINNKYKNKMKSKLLGVMIAAFITTCALLVSCEKETIPESGYQTQSLTPDYKTEVTTPMQTGFCCLHYHSQTPLMAFSCCGCKAVCPKGQSINVTDTLESSNVISGVTVEYLQNNVVKYSFSSDSYGHWDGLIDSLGHWHDLNTVAQGQYDVRFTKQCLLTVTKHYVDVASNGHHELYVEMEPDPTCEINGGD